MAKIYLRINIYIYIYKYNLKLIEKYIFKNKLLWSLKFYRGPVTLTKMIRYVHIGLGIRIFGSGSGRFLSGPGLSGLENLYPIGT